MKKKELRVGDMYVRTRRIFDPQSFHCPIRLVTVYSQILELLLNVVCVMEGGEVRWILVDTFLEDYKPLKIGVR